MCPLTRFVGHLRELMLAGGPPVTRAPCSNDAHDRRLYRKTNLLSAAWYSARWSSESARSHAAPVPRTNHDSRMIQIDEWTDPNPWVNLFFMAELLATSEVPPQALAPGQRIYTFPWRPDDPGLSARCGRSTCERRCHAAEHAHGVYAGALAGHARPDEPGRSHGAICEAESLVEDARQGHEASGQASRKSPSRRARKR